VAVDTTDQKIGAKIKTADKKNIPRVVIVGAEEAKAGKYTMRELDSGEEFSEDIAGLIARLSSI
ncbi:histidine--tRNA ligase, partial [Candidatus Saccharibacteria bacterium QS_8_54_8]